MNVREITPKDPRDKNETAKIFENYKKSLIAPVEPVPIAETIAYDVATILVTDLPSKFLPYPSYSKIKFQPYTWGDLQVFNASKMSREDEIKFILSGIHTEGFDKSLLLFQDFLFISVLRKLAAFDNKARFNYEFTCDECGKDNKQQADIADIQFENLDITSLPLIIDITPEIEMCFNPLTIGASIKLQSIQNEDYLLTFAHCVINMPTEKAYAILKNVHGDIIDVLNEADSILGFSEQHLACKCQHCNKDHKFSLPEVQHLVQPFRSTKESARARIRFS